MEQRRSRAKLDGVEKGKVYIVLPFDPAEAWGARVVTRGFEQLGNSLAISGR